MTALLRMIGMLNEGGELWLRGKAGREEERKGLKNGL